MTQPPYPPPAPTDPSTFVDAHDALSITGWRGPVGSRIRYAMSVLFDDLTDNAELAIKARFPSLAPTDAYPWLAADRLVDIGVSEPNAHIVARLLRWLEAARYFGTNIGIITSVLGYLYPLLPQIQCVNQLGTWWSYAGGVDAWPVGQPLPTAPVQTATSATYWKWDGLSDPFIGARGWWRTWVIVHSPLGSPWSQPAKVYGDGVSRYGDGSAYNWRGSQNDRQMIQNMVRKFKGAHTYVPIIIVTYDDTIFPSSGGTPGTDIPDGHWGHWGKVSGTTYVPARTIQPASYLEGVA